MGVAVIIQTDERKKYPTSTERRFELDLAKPLLLKLQPLYEAFGTDATGGWAVYRGLFRNAPEQADIKNESSMARF